MLQLLILSFLGSLRLRLPLISSPILIGLWILLIAISLSAWLGFLGLSWFRLILFLVYIGAILVIFVYFVAITPNQRHSFGVFYIIGVIILGLLMRISRLDHVRGFRKSLSRSNIIALYLGSQGVIFILIFIILLITLIIVVKITRRVCGPLRPFK